MPKNSKEEESYTAPGTDGKFIKPGQARDLYKSGICKMLFPNLVQELGPDEKDPDDDENIPARGIVFNRTLEILGQEVIQDAKDAKTTDAIATKHERQETEKIFQSVRGTRGLS